MKKFYVNGKKVLASGAALVTLAAAQAHAALDPAVATTITGLSDDAGDLLPLLYGAMAVITGGFVVFGLVKKGIRRVA